MINFDSLNLEHTTVEELGEILMDAKKAYYTGGKPVMDDHTFDTLEEVLRQKSPHHRLFSKVGHKNFDTGWPKKHHTHPMSSQNKVNTFEGLTHYFELKKLPTDIEYVVQPKCDGISLEIEYSNGIIIDAITRGDGIIGDVITQNVVKMKNFVAKPSNFTGSIRCEIVVTKDDFSRLNSISTDSYSNPRNAASGLSQRLDSKYSEYCTLYAVDILTPTSTEWDKVELLTKLGFTAVESKLCRNLDQIEFIYQEFLLDKRTSYPYDIDGLVIKINDLAVATTLGQQNNRPKFQVAYKFPSSTNQTIIKSITWQVGPMGAITPVAKVEPIELSGAIITFASLANYNLIKKKNINVGDIVEISRRGDVIPHIEKVITKVTPGHATIPKECPYCHCLLIVQDKFLLCPNSESCLPQILGCLRLFCDKLEILGMSDKTIAKLYLAKKIKTPGDFYNLTIADISNEENLGEKSAKNILHQIDKKRNLTLLQVFDAAVIPHFSHKRIIQIINSGYNTPQKLLSLQLSDLLAIKGFKTTLANKIINGIQLRKLWIQSILENVKISNQENSGRFSGQIFCITGTLSQPRKIIEEIITLNGGSVNSSVSKNTNYLISNSVDSHSSKFINANKFGTKVISEAEFSSLLN